MFCKWNNNSCTAVPYNWGVCAPCTKDTDCAAPWEKDGAKCIKGTCVDKKPTDLCFVGGSGTTFIPGVSKDVKQECETKWNTLPKIDCNSIKIKEECLYTTEVSHCLDQNNKVIGTSLFQCECVSL